MIKEGVGQPHSRLQHGAGYFEYFSFPLRAVRREPYGGISSLTMSYNPVYCCCCAHVHGNWPPNRNAHFPSFSGGEGGPQGKALSDGRRRNAKGRPLLVGVSAPQGCGKTTLVEEMRRMLEKAGHSCAVLSIDDFYLTRKDQACPVKHVEQRVRPVKCLLLISV